MSSNLSTQALVAALQERLPMGFSSAFCFGKLNEAFQWVEQRGPFNWDTRLAVARVMMDEYWINLTGNSISAPAEETDILVQSLDSVDLGKPLTIWRAGFFRIPIPYKEPQELGNQQLFNTLPEPGIFSCYTVLWEPILGCFQIRFAPSTAACDVNTNYAIEYHVVDSAPTSVDNSTFYPSPNVFDYMLLDLAEAEIRRLYRLAGWSETLQKAQASAAELVDKYRSTKLAIEGAGEVAKTAQESQASRAE